MLTYRARLRPRSAVLTPWRGDTLFGHFCWVIRHNDGQAAVDAWLQPFLESPPPFVLSDGFPGDWLPRPHLPATRPTPGIEKAVRIAAMQVAKSNRGVRWVDFPTFNAMVRGNFLGQLVQPAMTEARSVLKNSINRLAGGTTPVDDSSGGSLYSAVEISYAEVATGKSTGLDITFYVKVADEHWGTHVRTLFTELGRTGYGAKKSAGYGQFSLVDWAPFDGFELDGTKANGFVGLSHWVPSRDDPTDGYYATHVKYGKVGEGMAPELPFKRPLVMLAPGSAFHTPTSPGEWYGRMVRGLAPANIEIVDYGLAFAVPARIEPGRSELEGAE